MKLPRLKWPKAYRVSCSDDGQLLACLGRNVVVIGLAARRRVSTSHPLSHPANATFSPNGETLAIKATSGRIVIIDPRSGEALFDHKNQKDGEGCGVGFSPDGNELIDGSWRGDLTIRNVQDSVIRSREHFPGEMITRVTHDQSRRIWLVEHSPICRPEENFPPPSYISIRHWPFSCHTNHIFPLGMCIESATLSPDGARFCFFQRQGERRVCAALTSNGQVVASSSLLEIGGTGSELAWSRDGRHIAAVSKAMFVFLRADDLTVVGRVPCKYPSSIAFLPHGNELVLGSWETTAIIGFADVLTCAPIDEGS
jgi:WD40 repeat protein